VVERRRYRDESDEEKLIEERLEDPAWRKKEEEKERVEMSEQKEQSF